MKDIYVGVFNNHLFNQDGNVSTILRINNYNPRDFILQKFNLYHTLTSVDLQEIVKIGVKVLQIFEGVVYRENFKISPFRKVKENLFPSRKKRWKDRFDARFR